MKKTVTAKRKSSAKKCGLCGRRAKLTKTPCCGQWICDDNDKYVLFSYARNSCWRNHVRFTLCGYHDAEGHDGDWKDCAKCRADFPTEMYVWYGTNEYNFEKLEHPPSFSPTLCSICRQRIVLSEDCYTQHKDEYWCEECAAKQREK